MAAVVAPAFVSPFTNVNLSVYSQRVAASFRHNIPQGMERKNRLPPVHPGEILREDVLPGTGLSITGTAKVLGVSRQTLHAILAERKPLSPVMCLKISRLLRFENSSRTTVGTHSSAEVRFRNVFNTGTSVFREMNP